MTHYAKHFFFCINQRPEGKNCCNNKDAEELYKYAKLQARKLTSKPEELRINSAGCLGKCQYGPVLVIYPDAVWYKYQTKEDIGEILTSHLQFNQPVKRLMLELKEAK